MVMDGFVPTYRSVSTILAMGIGASLWGGRLKAEEVKVYLA